MRINHSGSGPPPPTGWTTAGAPAAESIRSFDWTATNLGAVEAWPVCLTGCARVMLQAVTPVALAWGEDLTIIPNDAWRTQLGGTELLGRSAVTEERAPWPALREHLHRARREGAHATLTTDGAALLRFHVMPLFQKGGSTAGLWIDAETSMGPRPDWLPLALDAGRLAIWDWDVASGTMIWSDALHRLLGYAPGEIQPTHEAWLARLHPQDATELDQIIQTAIREGGSFECSFRVVRPDETVVWCETRGKALQRAGGEQARVTGVVDDVTELVHSRDRQRRLQHDLLHRVRNVLAVIRSIVLRTAETRHSVDDFASHLEGRINTLARHQSILLQSPEGVDLQTLLLEELRRATAAPDQAHLDGPEVSLPPRVAQTLCLAIHELTTNAVKFGALSQAAGQLDVTWSTQNAELNVLWRERGIPTPTVPSRRGFGMSLIEVVLPYELGARVVSDFSSEGFSCQLVVPLRRAGP